MGAQYARYQQTRLSIQYKFINSTCHSYLDYVCLGRLQGTKRQLEPPKAVMTKEASRSHKRLVKEREGRNTSLMLIGILVGSL